MRIFFATDVHGSETCWRKFLNSRKHYKADVLILGGDMTGKALVPVIDDGDGRWHGRCRRTATTSGRGAGRGVRAGRDPPRLLPVPHGPRRADGAEPIRAGSTSSSTSTCSAPCAVDADRRREARRHRHQRVRLPGQRRPVRRRRVSWRAAHRSSSARVAWSTSTASRWPRADGPTARRGTPTARRTSRVLLERIPKMVDLLTAAPERTDPQPALPAVRHGARRRPRADADMELKDAGHAPEPVGSTAVREAIERSGRCSRCTAISTSLVDTRLGKTLCINPGSSYEQGSCWAPDRSRGRQEGQELRAHKRLRKEDGI